jgi:hypothetical protein
MWGQKNDVVITLSCFMMICVRFIMQLLIFLLQISDINERNFTLAKWKLFTDNFALYDNELSNTQLETCANLMVESVLEESQLHG